ncbi:MAG: DUF488 family protein [Pseudomonadota bacterium]
MPRPRAIYTVGHSTRTLPEFETILEEAGIGTVVDVRAIPRSRTNPQFNREVLREELAKLGIGYEHVPDLGGRRGKSKTIAGEVNAWWENTGFHNYADHALTESFRAGLARLLELAQQSRCAIMCAEAVWWRCHRRIIADYLLERGVRVLHLMGEGRPQPAQLTEAATVIGEGRLAYPASQGELFGAR